jgi:hypothetical protein
LIGSNARKFKATRYINVHGRESLTAAEEPTMTTNLTTGLDRGSATIYQFPPRGRYAVGARRPPAPVADYGLPHVTSPALGSAWYHDEAIREERDRRD